MFASRYGGYILSVYKCMIFWKWECNMVKKGISITTCSNYTTRYVDNWLAQILIKFEFAIVIASYSVLQTPRDAVAENHFK